MKSVNAQALTSGILAMAASYLCLATSSGLQLWALFIGWGGYFHCRGEGGGGLGGFTRSALAILWGVGLAAVALFLIGALAGAAAEASVIIGMAVFAMVLGAPLLAPGALAAGLGGFGAMAAFLLMRGVILDDILAIANAAVLVLLSLIIGNGLGLIGEWIAGALSGMRKG